MPEEPHEVTIHGREVSTRLLHAQRNGARTPSAPAEGPVTVTDGSLQPRGVRLQLAHLRGVALSAGLPTNCTQLLRQVRELLVRRPPQGGEPVRRAAPPFERLEHRGAPPRNGEVEVELRQPDAVDRTRGAQVEAGAAFLSGCQATGSPGENPTGRRAVSSRDERLRRHDGSIELVRE